MREFFNTGNMEFSKKKADGSKLGQVQSPAPGSGQPPVSKQAGG